MRKLNLFLFITVLMVNFMKCGGGGGGSKPPSTEKQIQAFLADGWLEFEAGKYDSAEYYFNEALALDNEYGESNAGKAWSLLMKDESQALTVENLFSKATADTSLLNDVETGLAIVTNLQQKYNTSINYVNKVLARESAYVFQHKTDINYQDLLVIQAHSYFYNKQFDKSYETLLQITSDFVFDPEDATTWVVKGDTYPSYEGAISAVLAIVANQYKSF
jgi:tetratricopeptide (TPR) repeat protein